MSSIHGDLNSMNMLTPSAARPLGFPDRQPFNCSITYGVAAYGLAVKFALQTVKDLKV